VAETFCHRVQRNDIQHQERTVKFPQLTRRVAIVAAMLSSLNLLPATTAQAAPVPTKVPAAAALASLPTDLMWFNPGTGEVSTWLLNGFGNVLGKQAVDWHCSAASGCSAAWRPIGSGDMNNDGNQDLLWFNSTSGEMSSWLMNGFGNVLSAQSVDWHCSLASGCASSWWPVGIGDMNNDGNQDLLWFNSTSGEVSSWLMNGFGNVLFTQSVDWHCSAASGCAASWRPLGIADLNNDGRQDLLWFNRTSGEVSTWLLNGFGNVLSAQSIDWHCNFASGCSSQWRIIGVGDLNSDGNQDVTWYRSSTGEVSSWLLNGFGNVLSAQSLDWHCDTPSGCAHDWVPVDLVD
jgi:hypothetical protein